MKPTVLIIGAFDTKGPDHNFAIERIREKGFEVLTLNTGVMGTTDLFAVDIEADQVAQAGGVSLEALRARKDRGQAMEAMSKGAPILVSKLYEQGKIDAIFGMGGTGGTSIITAAMRSLPLGFPKVCVSTAAAGNTLPFVGTRDIVLFPAITDVAGLNRISRQVYAQAVGALCGMMDLPVEAPHKEKPIITASMFGNTTECVGKCQELLADRGYEVLIFHAVGSGGKTMEDLVSDGLVQGVLDITTTEWADELCGGVFTAGPTRLEAPGKTGVPHLIVPGCIDMVNFNGLETVPEKYRQRNLYAWNPNVTLMRTTAAENAQLGEIFAQKANQAQGPVRFLIPLQGYSILDSIGEDGKAQLFWDPEADQAFISALKAQLHPGIPVIEADMNINDPRFAQRAVDELMEMMETHPPVSPE